MITQELKQTHEKGSSTVGKVATVVAVVLAGMVVLYLVLPALSSPVSDPVTQPDIQVTNVNAARSSSIFDCIADSATYVISFTLVNSGSAGGYATVGIYLDGNQAASNNYYVSQGAQNPESMSIQTGCGSHQFSVVVLSESK